MTARIAQSTNSKLAAARAEFEARKQAEANTAQAAQPQAFAPEAEASRMQAMMAAASFITDGFVMPSWSRVIIGSIIGLLVAAGAGWLMGWVLGALIVGAVAVTGIAWLGTVIYVLGIIYIAFKGGKLGWKASQAVIGGTFENVGSRVAGWFTKKQDSVTTAQAKFAEAQAKFMAAQRAFTGAYTAPDDAHLNGAA